MAGCQWVNGVGGAGVRIFKITISPTPVRRMQLVPGGLIRSKAVPEEPGPPPFASRKVRDDAAETAPGVDPVRAVVRNANGDLSRRRRDLDVPRQVFHIHLAPVMLDDQAGAARNPDPVIQNEDSADEV